jgi:hypothetical protein
MSVRFINLNSSVGTATVYAPDGRESIPDRIKRFVYVRQHPDRRWGSRSLLSNWYMGRFPLR